MKKNVIRSLEKIYLGHLLPTKIIIGINSLWSEFTQNNNKYGLKSDSFNLHLGIVH